MTEPWHTFKTSPCSHLPFAPYTLIPLFLAHILCHLHNSCSPLGSQSLGSIFREAFLDQGFFTFFSVPIFLFLSRAWLLNVEIYVLFHSYLLNVQLAYQMLALRTGGPQPWLHTVPTYGRLQFPKKLATLFPIPHRFLQCDCRSPIKRWRLFLHLLQSGQEL